MKTYTNAQIREFLGHNGQECRVLIKKNGRILRYGTPDSFDYSREFWAFQGYKKDIIETMAALEEI